MKPWAKLGTQLGMDGEKIIRYVQEDSRFEIESRRRRIPHANGEGYWYHTTYFLIDVNTGFEWEYMRLDAAKKAAEEMLK